MFLNSAKLIAKCISLILFAIVGIKRHDLCIQYLLCNQKPLFIRFEGLRARHVELARHLFAWPMKSSTVEYFELTLFIVYEFNLLFEIHS